MPQPDLVHPSHTRRRPIRVSPAGPVRPPHRYPPNGLAPRRPQFPLTADPPTLYLDVTRAGDPARSRPGAAPQRCPLWLWEEGRLASENGRLRHGEGTRGWGAQPPGVLKLPTLTPS